MRKHTSLILATLAGLAFFGTLLPPKRAGAAVVVPATAYFPILPYGAPPDAEPQLFPLASNHALSGDHTGLSRAIIVLPDASRDAATALATIMALAGADTHTTLILAPQFLLDSDITRFKDHLPDQGKMFARWPLDGWIVGDDSIANGQTGISSFTALDLLLLYLADKAAFPDLRQVVITGHGAGGDFVQRYAAVGQAPDLLDKEGLPVRFLVANASSYLYFTASRPKGGRQGLGSPDVKQCADFNAWPYGLEGLNTYARHVGASAIQLRYVTRTVTYLTGEKAITEDRAPDMSCAAMLEGPDIDTRAVNYNTYLGIAFGDAAHKLQSFVVVPKIGYDAAGMFGSACGMTYLFGDGLCGSSTPGFTNIRTEQ